MDEALIELIFQLWDQGYMIELIADQLFLDEDIVRDVLGI